LADFNLGLLYASGLGCQADAALAQQHYLRAAQAGLPQAQNNLAIQLLQAADAQVQADAAAEQAGQWLREAAAQNYALAGFNLAVYLGRIGDSAQALELLRLAAAQGLAKAQFNLGWTLAFGDKALAHFSQALPWLHQAAEQGDSDALYTLGRMQFFGQGMPADASQALTWYQRAADLGDCAAQFNLGSMYANAQGTAQDYGLALQWYRAAARQAPAPEVSLQLSAAPVATLPARAAITETDSATDNDAIRRAA
jgi:TPR repeat protein